METKAETFGEKSILFALATGGNMEDEYIEESIESYQPQFTSYLDTPTTAVSATQQILTTEDNVEEVEELVMTGDSSALVKPEISNIAAAKKYRDEVIEYRVQEGDTISSIADDFSITQNTVLWANGLSKFSIINPGKILMILPTSGISHKISKGDTVNSIAKKYQTDKQKIIDFNKLADESDIQIGQTLILPEGQPYYAPAVPSTKLASIKQIFVPSHVEVPSGSKMAWPTTAHRISQYYNWRHLGLDIDGEFGDPIWTAEDGIVTKVAYLKYGYGYHVIVDHGGGKTSLYAHFQKIYVTQGQAVARGDVLGEMGSTGYSTGSHLHLEIKFGSKRYNPLNYIR